MIRFLPYLITLILLPADSIGELPSRSELLIRQYQNDRAKGLTKLNSRYIQEFESALVTATESGDLEAVKHLSEQIQELKRENTDLAKMLESSMRKSFSIVGKSVYFPHPDQGEEIWVEFKEGDIAVWVGLGEVAVEGWRFKSIGKGRYAFWDTRRMNPENPHSLKIGEDGKSGTVTMHGRELPARIKETRRRSD